MISIDGHNVVGNGVVHFIGAQTVQVDTTPPLTFGAISTGKSSGLKADGHGAGYRFIAEINQGDTATAAMNGDTPAGKFRVAVAFTQISTLPDGPFYEVRYTITSL